LVLGALLAEYNRSTSNVDRGQEVEPRSVLRARILVTDLCESVLSELVGSGQTHHSLFFLMLASAIELIDYNRLSNSHLIDSGINAVEGSEETTRTCRIELHAMELDWDNPISTSVWDKDRMSGVHYPFDIIV
jgi:hypothetical protein